ncbi:MAG: hypothetical protein LIP16_10375, partial [Clostridium sp.]|nr:hypothetical protein [Clostridium sp.]
MTNYRRLISYIYAYEGEAKGKNIGFAKLESRNGQCKLSVNVKKVYVGSSDLGVYLLAPGKEIFLGSIFIRGGSGEFRAAVAVDNAADSGCSMDQCYGLTIHEKGESWRAYTTIWEDAVAQAAELELAGVTSESRGNPDEQIHKKMKELDRELKAQENASAKTSMEEPDFEPEIIDIPADTEVEEPEGDGPVVEEPEGDGSVVEEPDRSEGGSLPGERAWTAQPEGRDGSQPAEVFRSGDRTETGKGGNARYRISEGRTAEEVQAEEAGESRPEAWTTGEARAEEGNQWENQGEAGGEG